MAVVINGNGAVTGLTALPDSAMASGSVINTSSTTKTDTVGINKISEIKKYEKSVNYIASL